jgi:hypothetical protein
MIVIQRINGPAIAIFNDNDVVSLGDLLRVNGKVYAYDVKNTSYVLLNNIPAPEVFVPEALVWDGSWEIVDQAAYDLAIAPPPYIYSGPEEVSMHKAIKAMILTPWPTEDHPEWTLEDAVTAALDSIPGIYGKLAKTEFLRAPNLVRLGSTTAKVQALVGISNEERDELIIFADSLP